MQTSIKLGMLALPLLLTLPPAVSAAAQPGSILILDKNNAQCKLYVPGEGTGMRVQYEFSDNSDCKGVEPRRIRFDSIPSATQILIADGTTCSTDQDSAGGEAGNFWMALRTTRKSTSSDWYEFEDLASYPRDQIITPGLQMRDKYIKQEDLVRDRTSCIRVITSTTAPPDFEPAKWNTTQVFSNINPRGGFECNANQIMVGRKHKGDETDGRSTYTCATFKQRSTDLTLSNPQWSERFPESAGIYFTCPPNTVMIGREHTSDENGNTRYKCSQLNNGNRPMSIHWSVLWSKEQNENDSDFTCPTGEFLVGRYHTGDENKSTRYRCATAYNQGAEKP